jgi:hypothetical protein
MIKNKKSLWIDVAKLIFINKVCLFLNFRVEKNPKICFQQTAAA